MKHKIYGSNINFPNLLIFFVFLVTIFKFHYENQ